MALLNSLSKFYKDKDVLVTGHTGFKGLWLSSYLVRLGARVHGVSLHRFPEISTHLPHTCERIFTSTHYLNISDPDIPSIITSISPDVIFHFAAQALVIKGYHDPFGTWDDNLISSYQFLKYLRSFNSKEIKLVVATTDKVYNPFFATHYPQGFTEESPLGGLDPYSASKSSLEGLLSSIFRTSKASDLSHVHLAVIRCGNVIGGCDFSPYRILPDIFRAVESNSAITIRNKHHVRPWLFILDSLSGYLLATMHCSEIPSIYNLAPSLNDHLCVQDIVDIACSIFPLQVRHLTAPTSYQETTFLKLNSSKAYSNLDWRPRYNSSAAVMNSLLSYQRLLNGDDPINCISLDIQSYLT